MTDTATPPGTADVPPPDPNAVAVTVNGQAHVARKGQLVIEAAADAGIYIPRFCYHERMTPVGKCRMCLVECDTGRGPAVTVACMVPVAPDMKIETESPTAKRMQEGVLEMFLANHPLDCPVCDKGGECPLQDQTMSHGPGESRFVEEKRHYTKPIAISELVYLDRERCILCDRCTRFAKEVAGDPLIHFINRGNNTEVNTFPEDPFSSYFSGNTVQICPVGALTAKPYRFKARPWDLEQVESTCTTCSVGCRIVVQSTRDELVRYQGVDSDPVNWGWLCDKGRFGFEATNATGRDRVPMVRQGDELVETTWAAAVRHAASTIKSAIDRDGAGSVAVLGGARSTNEGAYAWATLARALGVASTDAQLDDGLPAEVLLGLPRASIDDACAATTIVVLGVDLKEELPVLFLRVRDAASKRRSRVVEISPRDTPLTPLAYRSARYRPGEQAAVVRQLLTDEGPQLAKGDVVVIVGRSNLAEAAQPTLDAIALLQAGLPGVRFLPAVRRGNALGALAAGLRPQAGGLDAKGILEAAAAGRISCLVLLGADPLGDVRDASLVRKAMANVGAVVAVDTALHASNRQAAVFLPATAPGEHAGTTTNIEGRVTGVAQKVTAGTARPDWMIAVELAERLGHDLGFTRVEDVTHELSVTVDAFAPASPAALAAGRDGVVLALEGGHTVVPSGVEPPAGNSYEYRLTVSRKLYDAGRLVSSSPSLAPLAPGARLHLHPLDADRLGARDGSTVKVTSPRSTITLTVRPDAAIARGTAWIAFNQPDAAVGELIDADAWAIDVKVESL